MPNIFSTATNNYRNVITKAANYTVLSTDELVQINGAYTMTLPVLSTLESTTSAFKGYCFKNVHATSDGTIAAGTGNTIGGRSTYVLKPGETVCIQAKAVDTDWTIVSPYPVPKALRNSFSLVASTSGTTAQNLVDAGGAMDNLDITAIIAIALDTNAGNIVVKNGTNTVATIAKSTTAGLPVGASSISYAAVASGATFTVESDSTNGNASVIVMCTNQSYA